MRKRINTLPEACWKEFEDRKKKEQHDPLLFSCNEAWEVFFITAQLLRVNPELKQLQVLEEIDRLCRNITSPIDRDAFMRSLVQALEREQE